MIQPSDRPKAVWHMVNKTTKREREAKIAPVSSPPCGKGVSCPRMQDSKLHRDPIAIEQDRLDTASYGKVCYR